MMESGNGIEQEINEGIVENDSLTNVVGSYVVNDDTDNGIDAVETNDSSPDKPEGELVDSSGDGFFVAPETKASDLLAQSGSENGDSRLEKVQNVHGRQNGHSNELQKKRPVLSQSRSFPSKGNISSSLRKSSTVTRQPKDASSSANGSLPANQPALAATTCSRRSLPTKTSSVDATVDDKSSETGNDCTLSARRSTISGFNFRLDERAERRKEFFLKLEEKNHAKEVEKSNLQEKSKESQEAEIRRLRKSLTFKATPMPSFYQEPGPPKVELKKIPPTRPRSPKLGRRKPPNVDNPSEASDSCGNTHLTPLTKLNQYSANRVSSVSKSSNENSFANLPSQKPKAAIAAAKSAATLKPKLPIRKTKVEKAKIEESEKKPMEANCQTSAVVEPAIEDREDTPTDYGIPSVEVPAQG